MEAKELRIGNWVFNDRVINKIENLLSNGVCTLKTLQDNFIKARYELIKPIPLTEEWLIKFGFKPDVDIPNWLVRNGLKCNIKNMEFSYLAAKLKKPIYVHQLQNLYFALTGEELILK